MKSTMVVTPMPNNPCNKNRAAYPGLKTYACSKAKRLDRSLKERFSALPEIQGKEIYSLEGNFVSE